MTELTRREVAGSGIGLTIAAGAALSAQKLRVTQKAYADEAEAQAQKGDAPEEADVVVLGAGAAGLSAAATAAAAGARVVVLEAGSFAGGATIYSGGHMLWLDDEFNASQERNDEELQKYLDLDVSTLGDAAPDGELLKEQVQEYLADSERTGYFDSIERVMVDHYLKGAGTDRDGNAVYLDYGLIRSATEANMDVLAWLETGGLEIADKRYGSHANSPVNGGASLVNALLGLTENAGAEVRYESRATGLLTEGGAVVGVRYKGPDGGTFVVHAGRVVVATGGYAANPDLAALYQNVGAGLSASCGTTNPSTNCGEGMVIAQRSGAAVRDLQFLVTVLEGYHGGSTLAEAGKIVGTQQLVVNAEGRRFVDEGASGPLKMTMNNRALNDQTDGLSFFVGDAKMIAALNEAQEGFAEDLLERDWVYSADTLEEVAAAAGLDPEALTSTVESFNNMVESGVDSDFGRTEFSGVVAEPPFVIAKMETHYHLTFGGLIVNGDAQVLDVAGAPIEGLYAAGDVTCGYEGVTHQSGACLSVVVHTGIIAGTLV